MKLNILLECFAMKKDLVTEKRKCQVLPVCQRYWGKIRELTKSSRKN